MPAAHSAHAPTDVVVVGGGLIGLCSAHSLTRAGHRVTVIDRTRIGAGAARGNAGEVTPLTALPLAGPGMIRETIRAVLSRKHYLRIAPLALPGLTAFGLAFLANCAPARVAAGTRALDQLTRGAFAAFDSYAQDGVTLSGGGTGYLYTHTDPAILAAYRESMAARADLLGMQRPDAVLSGTALREAEPALSPSAPAAFIAPTERYIDPGVFVDDLRAQLAAAGAQFREGVTAIRLDPAADLPTVVARTAAGEERIAASRIVLAGGAWTRGVLARSGARWPRRLQVHPGRGYSFTVRTDIMPQRLLGSLSQRTVAIPMSGRLRIVGLMDFDGSFDRTDPHRVAHLAERAAQFVHGADWENTSEHWVGPRPMTPNGLPIISPLPQDPRVLIATGHNMHGLSLGPVTGEIIAALFDGRAPAVAGVPLDLTPFALSGSR